MRKTTKSPCEKFVKDIKRARRKHYSSEEKIRIVLDGLRGEDRIAELCRREGVYQGIYAQCFLWPRFAAITCSNVVARD
jgi:transposase